MRGLIVVPLFVVLAASLHGQTDSVQAVVEGRIASPGGLPVKEAEIIWQGDKRSVLSHDDGTFTLVVPVRGKTVIIVRHPGYNAQMLLMDLTKGRWRGQVLLLPGAQRLADLEVQARFAKPARYAATNKFDGYFERQKLGMGTFISRDEIEQIGATHTIEILRGIAGIHVDIGTPTDPTTADIRIPRCQSGNHELGKVTVWINGARVIEPMAPMTDHVSHGVGAAILAELLQRIVPSTIEMVEVYRGVGQIPGEFHWDGCAAIAIWTRYNPPVGSSDSLPPV